MDSCITSLPDREIHSPFGVVGPTGRLGSPILSPIMSFAVAEYIGRGRNDIVVATDGRWVSGDVGDYIVEDNAGLKSIDLAATMAIAFTGHARVMAEIMSTLYEDRNLASKPQKDCLKRLEAKEHTLDLPFAEVVGALNAIVPRCMSTLGTGYWLSVTLAGVGDSGPTMFYWNEGTSWIGIENPPSGCANVRTLPPEAVIGSPIQKQADGILNGHGNWNSRIQRTISFLSQHEQVESVGGMAVIRRLSKGFALPQI